MTAGSQSLRHEIAKEHATPEWSRKMVALARRPKARAKIARSRLGKPMHPRTRKAFLKAAKCPKSEHFKQFMRRNIIRRIRRGDVPFVKQDQLWTRREIQKLGRRPDSEVALVLKRSLDAVRLKRRRLGIPKFSSAQESKAEE
jgi:hypothetical protein